MRLDKTQFSSLMKLFHDEGELVSQNAVRPNQFPFPAFPIRVMDMVQSTRGASSRGGGSRQSGARSQRSGHSRGTSCARAMP
eukprot:106600-Rhodomonas_salina.1